MTDENGESVNETDDVATDPDAEKVAPEEGIFAGVVGHKGAKAVVRGALRAGDVDVLLIGPPASGKSTMLEAVEDNVPGTIYRDGKRFTATRVQSTFKDDPPILLIDEIDALGQDAFDVLSNPMEHGRVTEDTHDETYDIEVGTQVIAACNSTRPIPDNILSRFRKVHFQGYSQEEMVEVCAVMLPEKVEWVEDAEMGREVGELVYEETETTDPRDVRDAARMANSLEELENVAVAIEDADADVESDPITPDQVARAKQEVGREKLKRLVREGADAAIEDGETSADEIEAEITARIEEEMSKRERRERPEAGE